jgi:hypothetical protein
MEKRVGNNFTFGPIASTTLVYTKWFCIVETYGAKVIEY